MTLPAVTLIFSRVLDTPDVDSESDFFASGGDSLLATRVLSAVYREFGVELTFDEFLMASTPALLACLVEDARKDAVFAVTTEVDEAAEGVPR